MDDEWLALPARAGFAPRGTISPGLPTRTTAACSAPELESPSQSGPAVRRFLLSIREVRGVPVDLPVGDHAAFLWVAVATTSSSGTRSGGFSSTNRRGSAGCRRPRRRPVLSAGLATPARPPGNNAHGASCRRRHRAGRPLEPDGGSRCRGCLRLASRHRCATPAGVPLFYSLSTVRVGVALGGHSRAATGFPRVATPPRGFPRASPRG